MLKQTIASTITPWSVISRADHPMALDFRTLQQTSSLRYQSLTTVATSAFAKDLGPR